MNYGEGERVIFPGSVREGARTRWLEESSIFPCTDAALCWNAAALQLRFL